MREIKAAFNNEAGEAVLSSFASYLLRSAEDRIADHKLEVAISFLTDERMVMICTDTPRDKIAGVRHAEVVLTAQAFDIINDSIGDVKIGVNSWSAIRREEQMPSITVWATDLERAVHATDLVIGMAMARACSHLDWTLLEVEVKEAKPMLAFAASQLVQLDSLCCPFF